jgi:Flp pilus assembly pilin Flp
MNVIRRLGGRLFVLDHEDGQVLVEYALIVSLIVIVCVAVITTLGLSTSSLFSQVVTHWP